MHLNADFKLTPDRRKLTQTLTGATSSGEVAQSRWNRQLTRTVLPQLWAAALSDILPTLDSLPREFTGARAMWEAAGCSTVKAMYAALPDLRSLEPQWRECCTTLYTLLRQKPILRHQDAGQGTPKCNGRRGSIQGLSFAHYPL